MFPALGDEGFEIDFEEELKDIEEFKQNRQRMDLMFDNLTDINLSDNDDDVTSMVDYGELLDKEIRIRLFCIKISIEEI